MKELIEKLRTFTVPELCDGCADPNVMDYRIKPAFGTPHICGRAVTLDIPEGIAGKVPDAIMELKEGDILVIAGKGWQKSAYWGDHRSVCAKMLGAEGVIIDGLYRDKEGCEAAGLPVFALGLCARSSLQKQEGQINIPVECAGAAVSPGDIICADQNGVIVMHPEDAEDIMAKAAAKMALQEELETREYTVQAGGGAVEVTINGKNEILNINISPDIVDPDDIETLSDVIVAGVNEAIKKVSEVNSEEMGKITGSLNMPGLF